MRYLFPVHVGLIALLALRIQHALADPTDWVNPNYLIRLGAEHDPKFRVAQAAVIRNAPILAQGGVVDSGILPPSGDLHDYLSWAPYHWPACNWCSGGSGGSSSGGSKAADPRDPSTWPDGSGGSKPDPRDPSTWPDMPGAANPDANADDADDSDMMRRAVADGFGMASIVAAGVEPTHLPIVKRKANKPAGNEACTRTSTPLPPSATWTMCRYVSRDGQVNPDVRSLNDSRYANTLPEMALYHAVAFVLTQRADYSQLAAQYIKTFFVDDRTAMVPAINYGQVIRGPDRAPGSYLGIVEWRGMVQLTSAVQLLRQVGASDWTKELDVAFVAWCQQYLRWLQGSPNGIKASQAANNHGTFYYAQVIALQIIVGQYQEARTTVRRYFGGIYQDQILASGEQPLEAKRTRPWHYRNFNLEGMIVNAKLGDQLGLNMWLAPTRQDATIQTALDYTMNKGYGKEEPTEIIPHMAVVAAVYGDSTGKYARYMQKVQPGWTGQAWYLWNQQAAFTSSPANGVNSPSPVLSPDETSRKRRRWRWDSRAEL